MAVGRAEGNPQIPKVEIETDRVAVNETPDSVRND